MKKTKKIYITTPIFYPSNVPHLGHAFTMVMADILKKYYQKLNYSVFLLTGVDEHGEKILKAAETAEKTVEKFLEENTETFLFLWKKLQISYDVFAKTTDEKHKNFVQKVFSDFLKQKIIYEDKWAGFYCTSCEENYSALYHQQKTVCSLGHELTEKNEDSYFFDLKKNQSKIKDFYIENEIISPCKYKKEIFNSFLNNLENLSVTRKNLNWGVKVSENKNYTIYVWFDALLSYISFDEKNLWNDPDTRIVQIVGKDILRFHAIYWPLILDCLNLKKFSKLLVHGWILINNKKMSKSLNNAVYPLELLELFPLDVIRFYLINLNWNDDNIFDLKEIIVANNTYLSNLFGNIISRFFGFIKKNDFLISTSNKEESNELLKNMNNQIDLFIKKFPEFIESENIPDLLKELFQLLRDCNKLIDDLTVWKIDNKDNLFSSLMISFYRLISLSNFALSPILIETTKKISKQLDQPISEVDISYFLNFENFTNKQLAPLSSIFFERYKFEDFSNIN